MIYLSDFEPWWRFGVALLIGTLLGLERELIQQMEETPDFAGIRTYALIALLGSAAAILMADYGLLLAALSFGELILLATASYLEVLIRSGQKAGCMG